MSVSTRSSINRILWRSHGSCLLLPSPWTWTSDDTCYRTNVYTTGQGGTPFANAVANVAFNEDQVTAFGDSFIRPLFQTKSPAQQTSGVIQDWVSGVYALNNAHGVRRYLLDLRDSQPFDVWRFPWRGVSRKFISTHQ
ncbi:hypothetical protein BDN72DRAFT_283749 [Pluteus cervinus]|uniref:Uncharacterized protein n=1 Tax=Pluteus cervinus TaxID=181527 RepID=A0ACD3B4W2_9AGAR|nr:hypothetical protein BDN72DRAFT_283749 [Pluteus cervinus]